jgi:hypothetical protein
MVPILRETSIDHYLGTNYVPNDAEIQELKHCVSEQHQRLKAIEDETALLELRLQYLHTQRADIRASIAGHLALLSPMRHLPVDLLREIFIACLPENRNPTLCSDEGPMLLTRICSYWRNVALTTPRLWAALHIPIPQPEFMMMNPEQNPEQLEMAAQRRCIGVKEFLSRSGSLPLKISTYFRKDPNEAYAHATPLLECIIQLAARWRDVAFLGPSASLSQIREIQSDLPQLLSLQLNLSRSDAEPSLVSWKESKLFKSEGLHSLSITSSHEDVMDFPLRWSQLTDLTLKGNDWLPMSLLKSMDVHRILRMSPALVSFKLGIKHQDFDTHTTFPPVSLRYLKFLRIEEERQWPQFFASFDVPSLKSLHYFLSASRTSDYPSLLALLSKDSNANNLEELRTNPHIFDFRQLVDILRYCGALQLIAFRDYSYHGSGYWNQPSEANNPINDALLQFLAPRKDQLCPMLEKLIITTRSTISDPGLLTFISNKQSIEQTNESNKLKNVDVVFHRRRIGDIIPDLSTFITSGLKVRIRYPPTTLRGQFSLYDGLPHEVEQNPYNGLWMR